jgi:hypothetical protein
MSEPTVGPSTPSGAGSANVPGPATAAMRLRPAARPGVPADVAGQRAAGAIDALEAQLAELDAGLAELLEVHSVGPSGFCRECLVPHPCATRRLVERLTGITSPPKGNDT